jgi:hypothetical protein
MVYSRSCSVTTRGRDSVRSGSILLLMSLRSAVPIAGKNFSIRIWVFLLSLSVSSSATVLYRAGRCGSGCILPAFCRLYQDSFYRFLLYRGAVVLV